MAEKEQLYRVKLDQKLVSEWQSEIGYQIAQIMACRSQNFRGLAFEILDAPFWCFQKSKSQN